MSIKTLGELLSAAEAGNYAVGAFNVSDLNQAVSVLDAARAESSPVIVQVLVGVHPYGDESMWWNELRNLLLAYDDVPSVLHLDHGRTAEDCARAIEHGFTGVMIDASRRVADDLPATLGDNMARTAEVVGLARGHGVSVEGELGTVGGAEAGVKADDEEIVFADPQEALRFTNQTGVDALAVAVGTSHGAVKFTTKDGSQRLRIPLIAEIKKHLPDTYLVLHGSSSIPEDAVQEINRYGGDLPESHGISTAQKQEGIAHGIRKINQGTDSHLAWTAALRRSLHVDASVVEPSHAVGEAMKAMKNMVAGRMREFGSAGKSAQVGEFLG